jgi:hypothetical protein
MTNGRKKMSKNPIKVYFFIKKFTFLDDYLPGDAGGRNFLFQFPSKLGKNLLVGQKERSNACTSS